jgi:hypothetical protein
MAMTADRPPRWDTPYSEPATPGPGSSRRGLVIAGIVVLVILVAVVLGFTLSHPSKTAAGGAAPVTGSSANPTAPSVATTTPSGGGSGIPAAQADPPSLAGAYSTDPITVMRAISAYSDWLFAHPNPALLANYMLPTCPYYKGVEAELTTLANKGWHARPSVARIQWIKVNGVFTPAPGFLNGHPAFVGGGVKAVIANSPQSADVLNSAGQVVTKFTNQQLLEMVGVNFAQGPDGQFRIIDEVEVNPPGGVAGFES